MSPEQPIFLAASLPGEQERQRSFSRNFKDPATFGFVASVDGRDWSDEQADSFVSAELKAVRTVEREKGKLWINPAAIACALTHRDKLLAAAERSETVLCEDDAVIRPEFVSLWAKDEVRRTFAGCDGVVLMHYASRMPITSHCKPVAEFSGFGIYKIDDVHVVSGACYFAPRAVARRIRQYQTPIQCSADHWQKMKQDGVFKNIYVVHPAPCSTGSLASNIGYGGEVRSNSPMIMLLRKLRRFLRRKQKKIYETLQVEE